ncbi:hypothetical protein ACHQM5_015778 [Ranunculus cassubicifolius]
MGSCISQYTEPLTQLTAKVITLNGTLREYSVEISVTQVLESESMKELCFVCNSDKLYYDEFIQPLDSKEELQMGEIYFVLPSSRLQSRLTAPDMAALAVKASTAMAKNSKGSSKKHNKLRVSPVISVTQKYNEERFDEGIKKRFDQKPMLRSGSVRKLQRGASRRAKLAVRSFRLRLSTIHEGSAM